MKLRWNWTLAAVLALAAAVLGWVAVEKGELEFFLVLIIPVIGANGAWGMAALLLAFAAFVAMLLGLRLEVADDDTRNRTAVSVGGVVLIGPLPIVFGTDRRTAILALVIALAVLATLLLVLLL